MGQTRRSDFGRRNTGRYRDGTSGGETPLHPVWAGKAIDLIHGVPSAGDSVRDLVRGAEDGLING